MITVKAPDKKREFYNTLSIIQAELENLQTILLTPLNAFLVGYSLDSILELFGTSLEGTTQVKSLKK